MQRQPVLEICVDSSEGLAAAVTGGADRIELCSALDLGGLTPGPGLLAAGAACPVPCHAMVRPRSGDFVLRQGDLDAMRADIEAVRAVGLAGVVIGAALPDGSLDLEAISTLKGHASGMEVTLHRVFDLTPAPEVALDAAMTLGLTRVLTSGQAPTAGKGRALIEALAARAGGRIEIMAGGGVTPNDAAGLVAAGVNALHASCRGSEAAFQDGGLIGIGPSRTTDVTRVAELRAAMMQVAA